MKLIKGTNCRTLMQYNKTTMEICYILIKKHKQRAEADVGFMLAAYNLKRIFNILDKKNIKEYFRKIGSYFFILKALFRVKISQFKQAIFF